ncbi:hypothetical protein M501DRAFT_991672 [Patellaria atrata CBS 101060]|uniref:Uncharacterized protein n=1 Tax=Patellaria atrata CBS 101060 TaxID=1346257 RepID=A0A9P4VTK8_9PEZI|nr:hypothetical protein M501DRAFT_991672 [Patellaria atrata CBS 101060]
MSAQSSATRSARSSHTPQQALSLPAPPSPSPYRDPLGLGVGAALSGRWEPYTPGHCGDFALFLELSDEWLARERVRHAAPAQRTAVPSMYSGAVQNAPVAIMTVLQTQQQPAPASMGGVARRHMVPGGGSGGAGVQGRCGGFPVAEGLDVSVGWTAAERFAWGVKAHEEERRAQVWAERVYTVDPRRLVGVGSLTHGEHLRRARKEFFFEE